MKDKNGQRAWWEPRQARLGGEYGFDSKCNGKPLKSFKMGVTLKQFIFQVDYFAEELRIGWREKQYRREESKTLSISGICLNPFTSSLYIPVYTNMYRKRIIVFLN